MENQRRITLDNSRLRFRGRSPLALSPRPQNRTYATRTVLDITAVRRPINRTDLDRRIHQKPAPLQLRYITENKETVPPVTVPHTDSKEGSIDTLVTAIQAASSSQSFSKRMKFRSIFNKSFLMSTSAAVLIIGGFAVLILSLGNNRAVTQQVQALNDAVQDVSDGDATSGGIEVLDETKISDNLVRSYSVSPDLPRYIRIKKINSNNIRILRMSTDENGAIKTPKSIWDTGWYDGSAIPGESNGASLIVGHVSGPTEGGIFYNLYRVIVGDEIEIEMGNGKVYTYQVVDKQDVPVGDINMNDYLISKDIDKQGLTIMTCSGEFNSATQQYENRLAIFAIRTN